MKTQLIKSEDKKPIFLLIAAFAAIYIFWGSTYLAIKYAIETLPPFLMAGSRFVLAGLILMIWASFTKDYERPKAVHWKTSLIVGSFLLLGGNGAVVFAEHHISSGLAALLVATEPFWIVILSWLWLKRSRPNSKVVIGLAVGFFGVWLLISGQDTSSFSGSGSMQTLGTIAVIFAALSWAIGSLYGLRSPVPKSALLTAGMQMFSGGSVMLFVSLILGEWTNFSIAEVSANSWLGFIYLTIFGSLIAFTAYSWLLRNAEPARVATYAYVNPVIAVLLGWLIAGESFTGQMLIGAGIIVGSVVLITSHDKKDRNLEEETEIDTPTGDCRPRSASV